MAAPPPPVGVPAALYGEYMALCAELEVASVAKDTAKIADILRRLQAMRGAQAQLRAAGVKVSSTVDVSAPRELMQYRWACTAPAGRSLATIATGEYKYG